MYFFGDTYFETLLLKNVFQIIFIAYFTTDCLIFCITSLFNMKDKDKKKKDEGSCFVLVAGCISSILADVFFRQYIGLPLPVLFFWIGCIVTVSGIVIRVYSVFTLKRAFTVSVQVKIDQIIIKKGPYKYIRHPAYSGSIISLLGIALCFRSIFGIIAALIITKIIYGYRIGLEEKLLENNFGADYEEYEKATWRIMPYIW